MKKILRIHILLLKVKRNNSNKSKGSEYIDQMFNLDYTETNSNTSSTSITKNDLKEIKDLNYFDEILIQKNTHSNQTLKNLTINNVKDFDFIDKTYFETQK
jgi:hypothetical protein